MIKYFDAETTNFTNGGVAVSDAISCQVTEELNGEFTLEMQLPYTSPAFDYIEPDGIVYANARAKDSVKYQAFRVYGIKKPLNGVCTISANHISYDLKNITIISTFPTIHLNTLSAMCEQLSWQESPTYGKFTFDTDFPSWPWYVNTAIPRVAWDYIYGSVPLNGYYWQTGEKIDDTIYGDFYFDNFNVYCLINGKGEDKPFTLKYGVNISDFQQDYNNSEIYDAVYPYFLKETEDPLNPWVYVQLDDYYYRDPASQNMTRVRAVEYKPDTEHGWPAIPTKTDLLNYAMQEIMQKQRPYIPEINITVDPALFAISEQMQDAYLEIGDTISVEIPHLKVSTKARITRGVFDSLQDRYISMNVGSNPTSIADTIAKNSIDISKLQNR